MTHNPTYNKTALYICYVQIFNTQKKGQPTDSLWVLEVSAKAFTTHAVRVILCSVLSVCEFVCPDVCLFGCLSTQSLLNHQRYHKIFRASSHGQKRGQVQKWPYSDLPSLIFYCVRVAQPLANDDERMH